VPAEQVAIAVEEAGAPVASPRRRMRTTGVVAGLTAAKVLGAATGFITGPLLARALGASGRGDLAAITVPLALAPPILGLGIPTFAYRELPRGRPANEVLSSLGLPLVAIGFVAAACAVPIADALAGGRATVRAFLIVGFLAMPLLMVAGLVASSLAALQRWRALIAMTVIPFEVPFVGIVVLYVMGDLTVATAAAVTIAGMLLTVVPGLALPLRGLRRGLKLSLVRSSISFGTKAWVGGLAQLANLRLDQLLMITAVAPRELGLYAVATTLAGAPLLAVGALSPPLMPRIAAGEIDLMPRAVRAALLGTIGLDVALALVTPTLLSVLFGPQFHDAIPMALVLLVANVPYAGAMVLSSALQADGAPLIPSIGEGLALIITVGGLLALLSPLGGIGAAIVSVAAYATSFVFQLVMARRRAGIPIRRFLVPVRADLKWASDLVGSLLARQRMRA
jgi:O-antigen/teichoic acid export membrane protein